MRFNKKNKVDEDMIDNIINEVKNYEDNNNASFIDDEDNINFDGFIDD